MLPKLEKALAQLQKDKHSLLNRISELSEEQVSFRPAEGEWAIVQVVEHLMLVEKITLFSVRKNLNRDEPLQPAGLKAKFRQIMLLQWLKSDKKAKAPSKAIMPANDSMPSLSEVLENWNEVNNTFVKVLDEITKKETKPCVFKHPITGYINIFQTLAFLRGHLNHHVSQINRIRSESAFPEHAEVN